ncbi:MAG: diguanylate cyclase, partial [Gemmatimonadetes bacterium]|nr:sensor domain-containing diguanylate cyclase [Gemmatimonadota bacterium]NIQ59231.1 sensor domain-containing diguanylate cyclase [Gemmatimonadota bacterium]NIU79414.1 diguanylate cyclase [Gammaproteobacteria bacterium]NIX48070.1 diguanylate cyclase [Gemmatimonadota bacterium]NIY12449.1 diguanylate cyclase [Gemmatimonadota bacterium]
RQILQKAAELVPSESGAILLDDPLGKGANPADNELHFVATFGPAASTLLGCSVPATGGAAGSVYRTGTAYLSAGSDVGRTETEEPDRRGRVTRSMVAAPIRIGDAVCGAIELLNCTEGRAYDTQDLLLLEVFASYTASTLQNALDARHARELAKVDDLTGLYNDRYFHVRLREELDRAAATGRPCSLLFIDLDHFKPINDRHGHLVGSQVLREIGYLLRRAVADHDAVLARYGGDEFTVVLPDRPAEAAAELAEALRRAVFGAVYLETERGPDLPALALKEAVTASIGVADTRLIGLAGNDPARELIRSADEAMYRAKALGKNRVVVAGGGPDPDSPLATRPTGW